MCSMMPSRRACLLPSGMPPPFRHASLLQASAVFYDPLCQGLALCALPPRRLPPSTARSAGVQVSLSMGPACAALGHDLAGHDVAESIDDQSICSDRVAYPGVALPNVWLVGLACHPVDREHRTVGEAGGDAASRCNNEFGWHAFYARGLRPTAVCGCMQLGQRSQL
eukprot:jgi/Ulvmu1/10292/UM060_0094.1